MDIKEITLRRIQAIRDAEAAEKEKGKHQKEAQRFRELEFFKPLRDIWESVKDLPAQNFRRGERRKVVQMWEHAWRERLDTLDYARLVLRGWNGEAQFTLRATTTDGVAHIEHCTGEYSNPTKISMTGAEDMLLKHIAKYLIIDDEQTK